MKGRVQSLQSVPLFAFRLMFHNREDVWEEIDEQTKADAEVSLLKTSDQVASKQSNPFPSGALILASLRFAGDLVHRRGTRQSPKAAAR